MFSLESFYSVLYSNLLKPANFYYQHFYPFGSTNLDQLYNFSDIDDHAYTMYATSHKCLAWDQEPLIPELVLQKNNFLRVVTKKYCHILANSERSEFKTYYTQNFNWLNWYYFFHGFAALDWYRNYPYFNIEEKYNNTFMSLNHLWQDDRSYRLYLLSKLKEKEIIVKGAVSLHCDSIERIKQEFSEPDCKLSTKAKVSIYKNFNNQKLPIIADKINILGNASASGALIDLKFNKSALWHLVSETVFYYDKRHLTEKIFKPIVSKRPFILVGATNNLAYLKEYGFQTFDKWIDESYDTITDNDDRIDAIVEQLSVLCTMDKTAEKRMYLEMQEVLDYNFNHFYNGKFKYKISKELVDNFKGCCTAWNQNVCREADQIPIGNVDFDKTLSTLIA